VVCEGVGSEKTCPKFHLLACELRTVIWYFPFPSVVRPTMHGSGDAGRGVVPTVEGSQSAMATPSRNICTSASCVPAGSVDGSTLNTNTSGLDTVASGASMCTCLPKNVYPVGSESRVLDTVIATVPAFGVVTPLSTGSVDVPALAVPPEDTFSTTAAVVLESLNSAVTLFAASIVTSQVLVPVHAPPQPSNVEPVSGVAVRVTAVPSS
jgi:hypothetical protein